MQFNPGSIAVSVVLSVIIVIITVIIVSKKLIAPLILALVEEKTQEATDALSRGMSALGTKSGETRSLKKMEKLMFEDILKEYPEIELLLDWFSPETAELIRENPERALILINRYKPIMEPFLRDREGMEKTPYQY